MGGEMKKENGKEKEKDNSRGKKRKLSQSDDENEDHMADDEIVSTSSSKSSDISKTKEIKSVEKKSKKSKKDGKERAESNEGDLQPSPKKSKVENTTSLDNFRISGRTKNTLRARGIDSLFPIQCETFNHIYDGNDLIGRARTGMGKTLAFALPVIERLIISQDGK